MNNSDLNQLVGTRYPRFGPIDSQTISGGEITISPGRHYVEVVVEGGTGNGADNLDTVNGCNEGDVLVLCPATSGVADTVTARDGIGNLSLAGNFAMDHVDDRLTLLRTAAGWVELSRSGNA